MFLPSLIHFVEYRVQGSLHSLVFYLSWRRRGEYGSQSRRQPRQLNDPGHSVLPEEPEEDHVLPGIQKQALSALRHFSSQWNLWQAGQHVCNRMCLLIHFLNFWHFRFVRNSMLFSCFSFFVYRYMELVHTDSNFEPEESFFQLFSDPRSTRLTRVQLREDFVRDRDLEAIRKQVWNHSFDNEQFLRKKKKRRCHLFQI